MNFGEFVSTFILATLVYVFREQLQVVLDYLTLLVEQYVAYRMDIHMVERGGGVEEVIPVIVDETEHPPIVEVPSTVSCALSLTV